MSGRGPGIAIGFEQAHHGRSPERDAHEVMAERARSLECFPGGQRGDPERRSWFLRRARQRGGVFEAVEATPRGDLLLLEQAAHLLESLLEAGAALIHGDAE